MRWLKQVLSVDSRVLLAYYAIVPVLILIAGWDRLFNASALKAALPQLPETYLWWTVVFNLPHIMASFVTYAEPAYVQAYRRPLAMGMAIALGLTLLIPALTSVTWLFVFGACYTMYHVLMQQYGISLMLLKRAPDRAFQWWRWLSISGASLMYLQVYYPPINDYLPEGSSMDVLGTLLLLASLPPGLVMLARVMRMEGPSVTSKAYFVSTFLMIAVAAGFYHTGYLFFMFLIPRFVHDATAFTVYAVHDHNRNIEVRHNLIYRVLKPLHIPPAVLCLPVGIAIAYVFSSNEASSVVAAACVSVFSFLHYYMEGHMWKRGTLHRQYAPFHVA